MLKMLCHRVAQRFHHNGDLDEAMNWGLNLFDSDVEVGLIAIAGDAVIGLANTEMPWKSYT